MSTVLSQEGNAWRVSGANVFAANLLNAFPSLCDYSTGEVSLDEEALTAALSRYMELLSSLDQESIEADGGVWPNFLSADRPLDTLFLNDDLFLYLDIAYAQKQELAGGAFRRPGRLYRSQCDLLWGGVRQLRRRGGGL